MKTRKRITSPEKFFELQEKEVEFHLIDEEIKVELFQYVI